MTDQDAAGAPAAHTCEVDLAPLAAGERWYVVHALPHGEERAQARLGAQGFRTFLPRYLKTVRHARRLRTVRAPFFPRYLFVALDLTRDRWRCVNSTGGVASLVMGDAFPLAAPPGVVEGLAAACGAGALVEPDHGLAVGDRVRMLGGPFAGLVGEMVRLDGPRRVQVLLALMGAAVAVSVERDALVRAA